MNERQSKRCEWVLSETFRGLNHAPKIHKHAWGLEVNPHGDLSTFDFDTLTRLVLSAHQHCVRAEITSSGPGRVKIMLHPRDRRTGSTYTRHPSIQEAVKNYLEHVAGYPEFTEDQKEEAK